MTASSEHHDEYSEEFVAGLEWMWGEGFLSPGGHDEVAALLGNVDIRDKTVLDIGCGIGGVDRLLVERFGAAHVTGIDVEAPLVARATAAARKAGLAERCTFQLVEPGRLPFEDGSFDIVFSKDSMIHILDKRMIYAEIGRVLKPAGYLTISDWFGSAAPPTAEFQHWLEIVGLSFNLGTIEEAAALLAELGFSDIETNDRNGWYADYMAVEMGSLQGENYQRLAAMLGEEFAAQRYKSSAAKQIVVDQGQLRPGHVRAQRPL